MSDQEQSTEVLRNLRVVELAGDCAGELVGKLLAGMGADVVKIELPEGSSTRHVGPHVADSFDVNGSLTFWYYNNNKKSAVLDYRTAAGREALLDLIRVADVVISGIPPAELRELDLDLAKLQSGSPELILISVTPFGLTGPWAEWSSSDLVALALGTPLNSCGYDDHSIPPIRPGGGQSSHTAASFAFNAVLLALLERQQHGHGQLIDVAVHDCLAVSAELANLFWFYPRAEVQRQTCRAAQPTPSQPAIFQCADDKWVYLATFAAEQKGWLSLLDWIQSKDLAVDLVQPEYQDPAYRQKNFSHIQEVVEVFFRLQPAEEAYHEGQARGLAIGPLYAPEELFEDIHLRERGFFTLVEHDNVGAVPYPSVPFRFSNFEVAAVQRAPDLGEHTSEVSSIWAE